MSKCVILIAVFGVCRTPQRHRAFIQRFNEFFLAETALFKRLGGNFHKVVNKVGQNIFVADFVEFFSAHDDIPQFGVGHRNGIFVEKSVNVGNCRIKIAQNSEVKRTRRKRRIKGLSAVTAHLKRSARGDFNVFKRQVTVDVVIFCAVLFVFKLFFYIDGRKNFIFSVPLAVEHIFFEKIRNKRVRGFKLRVHLARDVTAL